MVLLCCTWFDFINILQGYNTGIVEILPQYNGSNTDENGKMHSGNQLQTDDISKKKKKVHISWDILYTEMFSYLIIVTDIMAYLE